MTFEEAKDQVAINNGFKNWTEFVQHGFWQTNPIKEAAELYAKSEYNRGYQDATDWLKK